MATKVTRLKAESHDRRSQLVERFMTLRPALVSVMQAVVPEEVRDELGAVTSHQLQALTLLPAAGLTMHELAKALQISSASACALADRLVRRHLVVRADDPSDRRIVRLVRTAVGDQLALRWAEAKRRSIAALLERLSDDQAEQFLALVEVLAEHGSPVAEPPLAAGVASS